MSKLTVIRNTNANLFGGIIKAVVDDNRKVLTPTVNISAVLAWVIVPAGESIHRIPIFEMEKEITNNDRYVIWNDETEQWQYQDKHGFKSDLDELESIINSDIVSDFVEERGREAVNGYILDTFEFSADRDDSEQRSR